MKLSILIPVYNEKGTLSDVVSHVIKQDVEGVDSKEVIIVDDGSNDGSQGIIEDLMKRHPEDIKSFFQPRNMGKGSAIRKAIELASGDIAIIQDADLEYDPSDYPDLIMPILKGHADVVFGTRFMSNGPHRALYFRHAVGNRLLTLLSNMLTNLHLTDMETGYKVFRLDILKTIPLRSNRFGFEPEITAKIARRNLRIFEVPISYFGRTYGEGKKVTWKDGLQAIWVIFKYWLIDDSFKKIK